MVFQNSEGIHFSDVVLVGQGASGPISIAGLSLVVDGRGITVVSPQEGERNIQWSNISSLLWGSQAMLADGRTAWALDVFTGAGSTKFLVPADSIPVENIASIGAAMNSMKESYGASMFQPQYPVAMQPPIMSQPPTLQQPPMQPPTMQPPTMQPPQPPTLQQPPVQPPGYSPPSAYVPPSFIGVSKNKHVRKVPSKAFIIVLVALVVLGGGGIGGWYLTRSGKSGNTPIQGTPGSTSPRQAPTSTSVPTDVHLSSTQLRDIAQSANILLSDLPSTWRVCGNSCNSSGGSAGQPTKAQQAQEKAQFAACLGVTVAQFNSIAGGATPPGTISSSSQNFTAGPAGNGMVQANSQVQILPTAGDVNEQLSYVENPKFPICLQKVFVVQASIGLPAGEVTDPSPAYATSLPIVPGVRGIDLTIPIDVNTTNSGVKVVVQFYTQIALIALGRFEGTLMIQIPDLQAPFFGSLITVMEHRLISADHDLSDGHVPPVTIPPSSGSGGKQQLL
ncbi:MAG: hypothetical protein M1456_01835 [Actinobacteria bacterium]|nr:hypothetical protein [Actinomycetota bacterium]